MTDTKLPYNNLKVLNEIFIVYYAHNSNITTSPSQNRVKIATIGENANYVVWTGVQFLQSRTTVQRKQNTRVTIVYEKYEK